MNVHTYYDSNKTYTPATIGEGGSVSILYVMNTNIERLGNKTDAELVASFLERGFFVLVLDYQNNPAATGTALDWSVQDIRCQVIGGNCFAGGKTYTAGTYTDGKLVWECPHCGNRDQAKMNVARRTCGYIGTQYWNQGRTQEIQERVLHL